MSIFLKPERKDIFSQISIKFAFRFRKANIFIKISKIHGKWLHKNHYWCVFNKKIVATELLGSLTTFLFVS